MGILKGVVTLYPKIVRAAGLRGENGLVGDPEKAEAEAGHMYTDAKWHPKSSTYRLSCLYGDKKGDELYGEVVKQRGRERVISYWEREEENDVYGVDLNGIYEAESRGLLIGIVSYFRRMHDCSNPRPLIIYSDNQEAVADFNLCFQGLIGAEFFSGPSSKLSHVQARFLCEYYRVPVKVVWIKNKFNISDWLSRLYLRSEYPRLDCDTHELLRQHDLRDAGKNCHAAITTFGVRTSAALEAYASLKDNLGVDVVNEMKKGIWMREAEDVSREEYSSLYMSLTNDQEEHLACNYFSVVEEPPFKAILFVPKRAPSDLYDIKHKPTNIKLYYRGLFLMENCDDLVPEYLSFVSGIVDSDHWPWELKDNKLLEASGIEDSDHRPLEEDLEEDNKLLEAIRKNLVKKCIELFFEIAENKEDYDRFYQAYSKKIKLGFIDDHENRLYLAELLRFPSTKSGGEMTSLKGYVSRMKEGQINIFYYLTCANMEAAEDSPRVGWLKSNGYEVLHLVGLIDWFVVHYLEEFDGKKLLLAIE